MFSGFLDGNDGWLFDSFANEAGFAFLKQWAIMSFIKMMN